MECDGPFVPGFFFGDDVPRVLVDDVGSEKVEGAGRIRLVAAAHGADISSSEFGDSGFDLHGHEVAGAAHDEVEAPHLSPGLADRQTELDGAGHENHFGPLAAEFLVGDLRLPFFMVLPVFRVGHAIASERKRAAFGEIRETPPYISIELEKRSEGKVIPPKIWGRFPQAEGFASERHGSAGHPG